MGACAFTFCREMGRYAVAPADLLALGEQVQVRLGLERLEF